MPEYFCAKNARRRAERARADRGDDDLNRDDEPDRWTQCIAHRLGRNLDDAIEILHTPKLVIKNFPNQI